MIGRLTPGADAAVGSDEDWPEDLSRFVLGETALRHGVGGTAILRWGLDNAAVRPYPDNVRLS